MWLRLRLRLRMLRHWFTDTIAIPFAWNAARIAAKRAHEIAVKRLAIDANAEVMKALGGALITIVDRQAKAAESHNEVLKTWLEGFKVTQAPTTTAVTDKDEYDAEMQAQMEGAGVNSANPLDVMKWLERESTMATLD